MEDRYLIAHKVRGEAAFDVASQMECPVCRGNPAPNDEIIPTECADCDGLGYWWIIPTSGHRAYPFHHEPLSHCIDTVFIDGDPDKPMVPPPNLPDHYHVSSEPKLPAKQRGQSLLAELGLLKPTVAANSPPINRRI